MLRLNFDIREFIRIVAATKAWQSQAIIYEPTASEPFLFTAPALKRMSAEQLWDSTLTLVANNEWAFQRPSAEDVKKVAAVDLGTTNMEEFVSIWKDYNSELGRGRIHQKDPRCCRLQRSDACAIKRTAFADIALEPLLDAVWYW